MLLEFALRELRIHVRSASIDSERLGSPGKKKANSFCFCFCFCFVFFSIPFIIFALLFLLSLLIVTQIRGYITGSSPSLSTAVRDLYFCLQNISALSSLVDSRRIVVCT